MFRAYDLLTFSLILILILYFHKQLILLAAWFLVFDFGSSIYNLHTYIYAYI